MNTTLEAAPARAVEPQPARPKIDVLGCSMDNLAFDEAVDALVQLAREPAPAYVVTPNVDHLMQLRDDAAFRAAYAGASLCLVDGTPLLWAARLAGTPFLAKVSGSDLLPALCAAAAEHDLGVYFLGGMDGAPEAATTRLVAEHSGLRVVGHACPPRGFEHDEAQLAALWADVHACAPDIVFVALGAPKQELFIHRHAQDLGAPLILGVGAALDFAAGMVRRSPPWMSRLGIEWLYRLAQEPRRLAHRYLVRDAPFVLELLRLAARRAVRGGRP